MEILTRQEMKRIVAGRWLYLSDGTVIFVPDDEEEEDDGFIFP